MGFMGESYLLGSATGVDLYDEIAESVYAKRPTVWTRTPITLLRDHR